ncbi:DUF2157 domain-containing protein [Merismopedia glauca]|uniref:DUF2157 domain-containing protein n=1 Tax=Merismopedia glauca CCAP 1448/3 TaxID=1296344 RepID=A0A2T1C0A0_9CYAN|nr:DUF2157 domain-containing protein [Merismopedia glauca]PSB01705.1 DUF2157 domain-containing protein [Merismopedia glauca CCAP 1448/3]
MVSDHFRHQLRQEASLWMNEGWIDSVFYQRLSERYQFNTLEGNARDRFVTILIGLGSILIGLGVITFVAANWQDIPRTLRVIWLLSLFISVNIIGFHFWTHHQRAKQRLGHGLLLLGALVLGANMGLMGQMFHVTNPFYEFLLAWAVGVLAMAYSLRLVSLGVMASILMGLGYWTVSFGGNYLAILGSNSTNWASLLLSHMPILAGLGFFPLAYVRRSRVLFSLAAIATVSAMVGNLTPYANGIAEAPLFTGFLTAIAFVIPFMLMWSYDDSVWFGRQLNPSFQPVARNLGLFFLAITVYLSSSVWFWDSLTYAVSRYPTEVSFFPFIDILAIVSFTLCGWFKLIQRRQLGITTAVIGSFGVAIALLFIWHVGIFPINAFAVFLGNALLFLLAIGLIREGLSIGNRRSFWGGMLLITLRIVNWFLLANHELLFKSFVLILAGIGVIAIAIWFERYAKTLKTNSHQP